MIHIIRPAGTNLESLVDGKLHVETGHPLAVFSMDGIRMVPAAVTAHRYWELNAEKGRQGYAAWYWRCGCRLLSADQKYLLRSPAMLIPIMEPSDRDHLKLAVLRQDLSSEYQRTLMKILPWKRSYAQPIFLPARKMPSDMPMNWQHG
jgi:hypothetical protein